MISSHCLEMLGIFETCNNLQAIAQFIKQLDGKHFFNVSNLGTICLSLDQHFFKTVTS